MEKINVDIRGGGGLILEGENNGADHGIVIPGFPGILRPKP